MKTKHKVLTAFLLSGLTTVSTIIINKIITMSALSKELYSMKRYMTYSWRLGEIKYRREGSGKPLLLVHDLTAASSGYEWYKLVDYLKQSHTVYIIDLLGCGLSEKPDITYTNYLYVQMLSDFIKNIIGHRTDIVCSGSSSSLAVMACNHNQDLFDQLIFINPDSFLKCNQTPNQKSKIYKFILDVPVIGTLLYNIAYSKRSIRESFRNGYFSNPYSIRNTDINYYHESAHLSGYYAKKVYCSIFGNYTTINISHAMEKIDNSMIIIGGLDEDNIQNTVEEYKTVNPSIESVFIKDCKHLPHLEMPKKIYDVLKIYLKD